MKSGMVKAMLFPNRWVFAPLKTHTLDQTQIWWAHCFVPTPTLEQFVQAEFSSAILGEAGSGRGVALAYLARQMPDEVLLLAYDLSDWPFKEKAYAPEKNHFHQMMGLVVAHFLEEERWLKIGETNPFLREFFFWAVKAYLPPWRQRPLRAGLSRINEALVGEFERAADLYPDTPATYATQLQELRELVALWGYSQICLVCALHTAEKNDYYAGLQDLFGMTGLFEQSFINLRLALPYDDKIEQLLGHISGRLSIHRLLYRPNQIQMMVNRHIDLATEHTVTHIDELASAEVLAQIQGDIKRLYGYDALIPWLQWAHILLDVYAENKQPVLKIESVVGRFYGRYVPLKLDERGVWQGPRFIPLTEQLMHLLRLLFLAKGRHLRDELVSVAGNSEDNMYTIIRRLRRVLEPPLAHSKEYIYLKSDSLGYYLDVD